MEQINEGTGSEERIFFVQGTRYIATRSNTDAVLTIPDEFSLATIFMLPKDQHGEITVDWMRDNVERYKLLDDVFHEAFLAGVIFLCAGEEHVKVTDEAWTYLLKSGAQWIKYIPALGAGQNVLPGPCAISRNRICDVWKLVDDTNGTCMNALWPQQGHFKQFHLKSVDGQSLSVALPSRIKGQAVSGSSIAGWRMLIKDNIHLQGIKSSLGNKAFYDAYPTQPETAECLKRLIDHGVVILGKAKMSSFGNWEEPTDYTDYQAPWNPRGDGYQSPGASSSGCAAAISSYDWLDIAIGTDTLGIYLPFSSIIWPIDFWKIIDADQCTLALQFVKDMESHLYIKHSKISFENVWSNSLPSEAAGLSLPEYINPATAALAYDAYHNSDDFRARYLAKFRRQPYTTHPNQKTWGVGKTISKEQRDAGFKRLSIYEHWLTDTILSGEHSNALLVLPLESMSPRYRDEPPTFKRPPQDGINTLAFGPVMKSPVLAVPIGEIPYESVVTKNKEKLPFVIAVMAPPGTDLLLMDSVRSTLESAGRPSTVRTGTTMFGASGTKI
ncbi:uncharacterized protein GIQ15_05556 [Arthroderma uncinatum]|uniref:uncharacterized protein n=1 Tax=Arthroderma uncinatum TaxID=74035 RepID=UPI00144A5D91|nr:uncharacterized protein GIQ15_05556 [Arthroderma uncinatum]KAF3480209.1 hypothetical protein GIQ15_05556 [Arthroderma uncinatum]